MRRCTEIYFWALPNQGDTESNFYNGLILSEHLTSICKTIKLLLTYLLTYLFTYLLTYLFTSIDYSVGSFSKVKGIEDQRINYHFYNNS